MDIAPSRPPQLVRKSKAMTARQMLRLGLILLIAAGLAGAGYWFVHRNDLQVDSQRYQAVFLDNNQVFFGKLQNTNGAYLTLKNAYYVKGASQSTTDGQTTVSQPASTQLLKVSDTVYGPDDTMSIQSIKVLFWQNLKSDSKVAQAIDKQK